MRSGFTPLMVLALAVVFAVAAGAQESRPPLSFLPSVPAPVADARTVLPQPSPSLALELFLAERRNSGERDHTDRTVVHAELPEMNQKGDYELIRRYRAQPRSLAYSEVTFSGDGFVKNNVILRILQSEVQRTERDDPQQTAISEENYKFSYRGVENVNGAPTYVYQLKPRRKRAGLFKGHIYLDTVSAHLRRVEGVPVKSISVFIRQAEFVQDFSDFGGYTLPTRLHSLAKARMIGRTIIDIVHHSYQFGPPPDEAARLSGQAF